MDLQISSDELNFDDFDKEDFGFDDKPKKKEEPKYEISPKKQE